LGWSREALAVRSNLSWSAIEQIESGRRRSARPATLQALSKALGVTIDYLVCGVSPPEMLTHQVLVYEDDQGFLDATVPFVIEGVERSESLLAVTSLDNIGILREHLGGNADRVEFLDSDVCYRTPVSAMKTYRAFLDRTMAQGATWTRIVGDPGWPGRSDREIRLWGQYESLFNLVFGPLPMTVLCTYDARSVNPEILATARSTHPWIVDGGEVLANPTYQDPGAFVLGDEEGP
jgi:transcriptional regulator with XRE-family HTH domain